MNIFQSSYEVRLQDWYNLRNSLSNVTLKEQCIQIDNWWQKTPLVNHYLHPDEVSNWPDPWQLLVENTYCTVARGLGMCYTLLLLNNKDIELVEAIDETSNEVVLVLVDNAKYILNYWPDTVVNNCLQDFKIKKHINIKSIINKIGKL